MTSETADDAKVGNGLARPPATGDGSRPKGTLGHGVGTSGEASGTAPLTPDEEDRQADRQTFWWFAGLTVAMTLVGVLSAITEAGRGSDVEPAKMALWDGTSILVIFALMPLVAAAVSRGMPGVHRWVRIAGVHAVGVLVFSSLHIAVMVGLRKVLHPVFFGGPYIFTDNLPREFIYEFRKDALTYFILAMLIVLGRELAQKSRALAAAKASAAPRMLTFRSGGRTIFLEAGDVLWAKAEGNYAELHTRQGKHFVRTTLKAVADDLESAGTEAVRVHRSYLAVSKEVREAAPTGSGDLKLTMSDGAEVPVSRRYRDGLSLGG
ncbi:LytTR family transcriptional regulator [Parvularcula sp. ZS-1/3]|uniref:LytTR family transcriptional regulator n=1 Tax=Parvularcula mediterranea TaxID=2732508 RepID=A0A7Y3RM34_9PROT|nr:LytTR family DNA-binding domain-containing protein [Parvularcula mediterranea]NNU16110.1 LytTR family transcriptional regulator [Parvularcula mediterranea]